MTTITTTTKRRNPSLNSILLLLCMVVLVVSSVTATTSTLKTNEHDDGSENDSNTVVASNSRRLDRSSRSSSSSSSSSSDETTAAIKGLRTSRRRRQQSASTLDGVDEEEETSQRVLKKSSKDDSDDVGSKRKNTKKSKKGKKGKSSKHQGSPVAPINPGPTMEVRFSRKIAFDVAAIDDTSRGFSTTLSADVIRSKIVETFPLTQADYPVSQELCDFLQYSNCPSIVMPDDHEVIYSIPELVQLSSFQGEGCPPNAPHEDFWPEMRQVIYVQLHRRLHGNVRAMDSAKNGGLPWLNLPELWSEYSINEVAEAVHDEYPGYHQSKLIGSLFRGGLKPDNNIVPKRCEVQFLHGIVLYSSLNTWSINHVGPMNFAAKYHCGRARPEEVAISVHCSILGPKPSREDLELCRGVVTMDPSDIPSDIQRDIKAMNLKRMEDFTSYPEGSPMHPAWPAMHSAASNMSFWLCVVGGNLTPEQFEELKRMDLAVAMARTVAGVHYYKDNVAGLNMGQEITARSLPDHLVKLLGSDRQAVVDKIQQCRFDWYEEAPRLMNYRVPI